MSQAEMKAQALKMIDGVTTLPTIPEVATKVTELLASPDVELDEVADIILTDQVLAARVIRIVNSPLFRPAQEITSIKRALVHLGLYHIKDIVMTCSIISGFASNKGQIDMRAFWEHSFGVGVVARLIAEKINYRNVEKAYLAGIIHDLGQVFIANYQPAAFKNIVAEICDKNARPLDAEMTVIGTTHCYIGAALAEKWRFPDDYRDVLANHHSPIDARIDSALVAIINLADMFCAVRGLGITGVESWLTFNLANEGAWNILKTFYPELAELDVERFCYELDDRIDEIKELVSSVFE